MSSNEIMTVEQPYELSNDVNTMITTDLDYWGIDKNGRNEVIGAPGEKGSIEISLPGFYSCTWGNADELDSASGVVKFELAYDYEILTSSGANFTSSVETFESDLLKAVASEHGLISCLSKRRSLRNKERKLSITGAGSWPEDEIDTEIDACMVNIDSVLGSKCTPMKGYMTAWVQTEEEIRRLTLEASVYDVIENFSKAYTTDDVLAISYISTHPDDETPVIEKVVSEGVHVDSSAQRSTGSPLSLSPGAIVGIATSVFALMAVLAVVAKKRLKLRKKGEEKKATSLVIDQAFFMDDDDMDIRITKNDFETSSRGASVATEDYTVQTDVEVEPSSTFDSGGAES